MPGSIPKESSIADVNIARHNILISSSIAVWHLLAKSTAITTARYMSKIST
jgi:hypothetical protein